MIWKFYIVFCINDIKIFLLLHLPTHYISIIIHILTNTWVAFGYMRRKIGALSICKASAMTGKLLSFNYGKKKKKKK